MESRKIHISEIYALNKGEIIPLPQRSTYCHLKPIGVGTPAVESLTSYTARLAAAHSVSVGTLYEFSIIPALNKPYLVTPSHLAPASTLLGSFRNQLKNINGVGRLAQEWVEVLKNMTLREELQYLTFLPASETLTHSQLLKRKQSWCAICYEEMKHTSGIIYQPLIWSIELVQICDRHQARLVDECPQCKSKPFPLMRRLKIGFCPRCHCWLGREDDVSTKSLLTPSELEWQKFVWNNIGDLLAEAPKRSYTSSKDHIANWLQISAERITEGKLMRLSKLLGKPNLTVQEWYHGNVKPILINLLRICYCLDLRLVQLLTGEGLYEKKSFHTKQFFEIEPIRQRRKNRPFNCAKVKKQLAKYLTILQPKSLKKVSEEIDYDKGTLRKWLPDLCDEISQRYKDFRQQSYKSHREQREKEVQQACIELFKQNIYLSARNVAEFLGKPSYLGRRDVAAIIKAARIQLGQAKKIN